MVRLAKRDSGKHRRTHGTEYLPQSPVHLHACLSTPILNTVARVILRYKLDHITPLLRILGYTTLDLKPDPNSGPQCPETSQTPFSHPLPLYFSSQLLLCLSYIGFFLLLRHARNAPSLLLLSIWVFCLENFSPDTWVDNPFLSFKSLLIFFMLMRPTLNTLTVAAYNMPTHFLEFPTLLPSLASRILIFPGWHS